MTEAFNAFTGLNLQTLSETGQPPKGRIKDVASATAIYTTLKSADETSAKNRAKIQAMFDGEPPYSDSELRNMQQSYRCNLNFGNAEAYLEQAMSAYIDLVHGTETLVRVHTTFGEEEQRLEWNGIIAEEITRTMREWPMFDIAYLGLCHQFVAHGVGIVHWADPIDWRWESTGFGDVLIPRQTKASEEQIEVAVAHRPMLVTELFSKIQDREAATALGWNVDEVEKAIRKAVEISENDLTAWERFAAEVKNNDTYFVGARSAKVQLICVWTKEFDGTVSQYLSLDDGSNKEFLMKATSRYKHMNQAFVFFTYGIGTNGTYHSIRGLGHKIFPHIQWVNRLRGAAADAAMLNSSTMFQPADESALDSFSFSYNGPFAILPPGITYVERKIPDMGNAVYPVLQDMTSQMNERVGQYTMAAMFGGAKDRTRYEVAAQLEASSKLSITALNLFYGPWTRVMREMVRRMTWGEYSPLLPGGAEVHQMVQRCLARGVPAEAIYALDHAKTTCVRAVGAGSQAQRIVTLQQLNEYIGSFDTEGRLRVLRDQVAALVGYENANRYIPASGTPRLPVDSQVAQLENTIIEQGGPVQVFPNQIHAAHLEIHIAHMQNRLDALEAGEMDLEEATRMILPVHGHAVQHLEMIQGDPSIELLSSRYRNQLKSFGEILNNGVKHIQKLERERQAAEAQAAPEGQQQQQSQLSPEQVMMLQKHRMELKMMEEKMQLQLALELQKQQQKLALEDARAAAKIRMS